MDTHAQQTILIVDDQLEVVKSIARLLRREPYEVLVATSGEDALKLLAQQHVQVILSDIRMPDMDGLDFLEKARTLTPDAIRILISGDAGEYRHDDMATHHIWQCLPKPWHPEKLLSVINGAFTAWKASSAI